MERIAQFVRGIGILAAWIAIPSQILVAVSYIVGRQFFVLPATKMQEAEWHFFVALVFLTFGMALLANRHVRIDIVSSRMSERTRALIEIIGFLVAVLPFCTILIVLGVQNTWEAYWLAERSPAAMGLPSRWIVKSALPMGALLLLLAGLVVTGRNLEIMRRARPRSGDATSNSPKAKE